MKLADIIGTENRILAACWLLAVAFILILGLILGSDPISILGVAESREYQVNFDRPIEIKKIHVLSGQMVKKGDLLAELGQSELDAQLRLLRSRSEKLTAELALRKELADVLDDIGTLRPGADPLRVEYEDTEREISLIESRLSNLFIFAEIDGTVGAVNFKNGEKAPAFSPLITLLPLNPTYVNGYVNENLTADLKVGDIVEVASASGIKVRGAIVSIGSRIVPIPERLLRIQTLPAWGREVVIKIPQANGFLLGEKVFVHKSWSLSLVSLAQADEAGVSSLVAVEPQLLEFPADVAELHRPKISGIVFAPDLKQFLLISDDNPKDRPFLYLMNEAGQVQTHQISVDGLEKMEDIESLSLQGQDLYMMSSLSRTKKGKMKETRQLFAQVRREGMKFRLVQAVNFYEPLIGALKKADDPYLQRLYKAAVKDSKVGLEIEGHVVEGENLYLAVKGPTLVEGEGLLLRVRNYQSVLVGEGLDSEQVSVLSRFKMKLPHFSGELVLTDLIREKDHFLVASSCRGGSCSAIWKVVPESGKVELYHEFSTSNLEGLAVHSATRSLFAIFDHKSFSRYAILTPKVASGER